MSDMGLEAPDADSAEQKQDAVLEPDSDDGTTEPTEPPLEANEADAQEQDQSLADGEDEYR
jgi:hypothetical protein